jgi:peroxiredoxin/predicted 2-oxoglutarate/Fe(II)-dependent dioxygenase YbiX
MPSYKNLLPGDPAPWFQARATSRPDFAFDTAAGRYLVLCFFATASDARGRAAVGAALVLQHFFDDVFASFFGVTIDQTDEAQKRVASRLPGYRFFWDFDGLVSRLYGAIPHDAEPTKGSVPLRRIWVVLDPMLRVLKVIPFATDGSDAKALETYLNSLPPPSRFAGFEVPAPVLVLPNVFEPEFCAQLVSLYDQHGGTETGFMQQEDGKTVLRYGHDHKRRSDYEIVDPQIIHHARQRFERRVVPEVLKVYQFKVTYMERYIVACYSAEEGGHFRAHRDNTTKGTAHRRFAVSINLNEDFDGGEIRFPEYGPRSFKPPVGGAVVFSCSLLHAVSKMTRGRRYAFLPFLYDEAASKVREANNAFLGEGVETYEHS